LDTDTTNSVLQHEIRIHGFPEKPYEEMEVPSIGCQPKCRTPTPHFADIIHSMETVCKVKIDKTKSTAALM
jgi:hypothetical protein